MSTEIFASSIPPTTADTGTIEFLGGAVVKDHSFEIDLTDADASITAISIDFYITITAGEKTEAPASTADMYLAKTHAFTAAQITAKKGIVQLNGYLATSVAADINSITGEGAADQVKIKYHSIGQT